MAWTYLFIAGVLECVWAIGLKFSDGLTRPMITVGTIVAMIASFWLLSLAMRDIPLGSAYAIWTGMGAVGVAGLGMVLFEEPVSAVRILCLLLIITGIIGLKLVPGNS